MNLIAKLTVLLLLLLMNRSVWGIPLDQFFPYGNTAGDATLLPDDDESSSPITLNSPFPFFHRKFNITYVNINGAISFTSPISQYTPDPFPLTTNQEIIAPFWADVDTRGTGQISYRSTTDASLRQKASNLINRAFFTTAFSASYLFIATWDHVGYFALKTDKTNTFQAVLATDGLRSFTIFLYADGEIQWTTGDESGGFNGLGGTPAQVGFDAGDGIRSTTIPGSRTSAIINIAQTSNVGISGTWIFRIDEETIVGAGCNRFTATENDLINDIDITFVVDTSGSISVTNFQYVREFIEDIVLEMNIGLDNSRVAVILFSDRAALSFNLNRYTDKSLLVSSINRLPYSGGGTDIPEALNLLRTTAQNGLLGIRNDKQQIAIFLTDGVGGDVVPAVAALAGANIFQVYAVGVDNARLDQLNLIAFNNSNFVYYHSNFTSTSLVTTAEQIVARLRDQFVSLQPQSGSVLGGTLIQLIGNNIRFNEGATYTCSFDETDVEGVYITQSGVDRIFCVTPMLKRVGMINFSLSYSLPTCSERIILANDTFFSLSVQDVSAVETNDVLLHPGDRTFVRWSSNSIVPSYIQENFLLTTNYRVDISLYELKFDSGSYTLISKLATNIRNTGVYQITVPSFTLLERSVGTGIIGVSVSGQVESQSPITNSLLGLLKSAPVFGMTYVTTSLAFRSICSAWYSSESKNIGETIANRLPPCPPVRDAALNDPDFVEENFLLSFFHPGASSCFRQVVFTSGNGGSGQQCCYSQNGNIIVGPPGGGTVDRYAPDQQFLQHQLHDVLPFIFCCKGLYSDCSAYYDKRPSDDGNGYELTPPATAIGDPHIITLDGFKYTFNGKGEFILIDYINKRFMLQGRMVEIPSSQQATVFSAVVGKQHDSDAVQFEINQQQNGIDVIVGGRKINFEGIIQENFNNVIVFYLGDDTFAASFSGGCYIKVKEENGFISVFSVTAPASFKGLTHGLMGNYNGDTTDDLIPRYNPVPLLHNSNTEVIHYRFGITWIVSKNESLFTYNQQIDQSWELFYNPSFRPLFTINFIDPFVERVCGNDIFCMYDITVTGNNNIGLSTLQSSEQYDQIVQLSYPVVCEPPCVQGACVRNDTCNCVDGYVGVRCTEPVYTDCEVELCENGGTCRKLGSSYICECTNGFSGLECEIGPTTGSSADDGRNMIMIVVPVVLAVAAII